MTPGMNKVLAEIDQETSLMSSGDAQGTKYGKVMEEHTNLWRLLGRITEGQRRSR